MHRMAASEPTKQCVKGTEPKLQQSNYGANKQSKCRKWRAARDTQLRDNHTGYLTQPWGNLKRMWEIL